MVKERLRIKDATHVLADIDVPTTLSLVAQIRDRLLDADSELITQINVLPANGDEAVDAVELLRREEAAHGNDVQALSIDGAGFNGAVLRELQDPAGLAVDTYAPPKKEAETEIFTPDDFPQKADGATVHET